MFSIREAYDLKGIFARASYDGHHQMGIMMLKNPKKALDFHDLSFENIHIHMNNRDYKNFTADNHYHIYNRGNGKNLIFLDADDYTFFLSRLMENLFPEKFNGKITRKLLPSNSFSLASYCLMPNHFHFLIKQCTELPLSKFMSKLCTGYSKYFNKKYNHVGQVFQDQFQAIRVDSTEYLQWLSAYIHSNPIVANLTTEPEDWQWSSFREYSGNAISSLCDVNLIANQYSSLTEHKKFIVESAVAIKERKQMEKLLID